MAPEEVEMREKLKLARKTKKNGKKQNADKDVNTDIENTTKSDEICNELTTKSGKERTESGNEAEIDIKQTRNHPKMDESNKVTNELENNLLEEKDDSKDLTFCHHQPLNPYSIENILRTIPPSHLPINEPFTPQNLLCSHSNRSMTDLMRHAYLMTSWWRNSSLIPFMGVPGHSNPLDQYWLLRHLKAQKEKYL